MAKKQNERPAVKPVQPPTKPAPSVTPAKAPMPLVRKLFIILLVVACLVNANTIQNGFVLDDIMVITQNSMVRKGFAGIPELLHTPHLMGHMNLSTDTYRPLSLVFFAMEFQFFGENAQAGHFFNILWFAACVLILFLTLDRLFGGKRTIMVFVASLLFAVHPIHTEVTANIKSRDELLCFFFAFLSLYQLMDYMDKGKMKYLLLGIFSFYLSLISKETAITFLAIIPLVFFFYYNEHKARAVHILIGAVAIAGVFLGIREVVLNAYNANAPYDVRFLDNQLAGAPNAASRLATEILILGMYLKLCIIPHPLICNYAFDSIPFVTFGNVWTIVSLLVYLFLGGFSLYRLVKIPRDPWAFAILFFLATLSLFTNIQFLVGASLAERFAFFCSLGTCMLLALAYEKWVLREDAPSFPSLMSTKSLIVLVPLVLVYFGLTAARNEDWKDNYTLYTTDIKKSPNNTWVHYFVGAELQKKFGDEPNPAKQAEYNAESIAHLKRSLQIYKDNTASEAEIGAAYYRAKMYDSAIFHLKRSLQLNPRQTNAASNLGTLYMTQGNFKDAIEYYRQTVSVSPDHVLALFNLAVCHVQVQHLDSGIIFFKKSVELVPQYENYKGIEYIGMVYKMMGQMDSARRWELLAKEHNPKFAL